MPDTHANHRQGGVTVITGASSGIGAAGAHVVLAGMIARQPGDILNMSSFVGIRVGEASGVYGATEFFIRGITDSQDW
ncbi:hypothetical protein [Streptomyces sp. NPDC020951]|uniref:hypothetical protein n=1 Tax=Streptomyces sp. NPDC020951 TaxID=3365104 RepID=UPI00378E8B0C